MSPLGVTITSREEPPARGAPTATDTWFVIGAAASGSTTVATSVRSINEYTAAHGQRSSGGVALYDAVDNFFKEGGKRAVIGNHGSGGDPDDGLALFTRNHGPGQISCPGEDDPLVWASLFHHAADNNRFAIVDSADSAVIDTLDGQESGVPAAYKSYGMIVGPNVTIPGPRGVSGVSSRSIPGSATVAALCARVDSTGNVNQAAAGDDFPLQYAVDLKYDFGMDDIETLLNASVNSFADVYGVLEFYGFQTPDKTDPVFWQANCSRMRMSLVAQANEIGEHFMFATLDGHGTVENKLRTDLEGMLLRAYQANSLYGRTPKESFRVEVGSSVNNDETVALGELNAEAEVKLSLHAKSVNIGLVSVPVTNVIAA